METLQTFFSSIDPVSVLCYVGALFAIVVGVIGCVIPALPGLLFIALGGFLAALPGDFNVVGTWTLVSLGVMTLLGFAIDALSQSLGAQKVGATRAGIIGSIVGTFVGVFMGGLIGIFFMPFVGAVIGELIGKADLIQAGRVGVATWVGLVVGTALKVALAFMMIGLLIYDFLVFS